MPFFNGLLTQISHPFTTATVQCGALTDVHSVANASHRTTLSRLAMRPGEKSGPNLTHFSGNRRCYRSIFR